MAAAAARVVGPGGPGGVFSSPSAGLLRMLSFSSERNDDGPPPLEDAPPPLEGGVKPEDMEEVD